MTFPLTQSGIPFICYGDEIGMRDSPDAPEVEGSRARAPAHAQRCSGMAVRMPATSQHP